MWTRRLPPILVLFALAAFWAGCPQSPPTFLCDQRTPGGQVTANGEHLGEVQSALNAKVEALWEIKTIPVCWETSAMATVSADDREIVRQAIQDSWETALAGVDLTADQLVHFEGWKSCADDANAAANGIRISETAGDPMTLALGKELKGVPNGMQLNFTFATWSPSCADADVLRKHCVYAIAVHEFGHALGLAHEQNRTDTPSTCKDAPQGEDGNIYLGQWDSHSVMNYCNPVWNNSGILSDNDESGIRTLYYPKQSTDYCANQASVQPGGTSP